MLGGANTQGMARGRVCESESSVSLYAAGVLTALVILVIGPTVAGQRGGVSHGVACSHVLVSPAMAGQWSDGRAECLGGVRALAAGHDVGVGVVECAEGVVCVVQCAVLSRPPPSLG